MSFSDYLNANRYLNEGLIRLTPQADPSGRTRRQWMEQFLGVVDNPQRAFPAIHVAGTSGKGSIATFIAEILRAHGLRVGLHSSPYLQVSLEKLWVDGRYASARELADLVEWLRPHTERWKGGCSPVHAMAWVALSLEFFRRREVDVAVVEVGVGGRDDPTNVLQTITAVVGAIGLDHTKSLGATLPEIALHKLGIARPDTPLVVLDQPELHDLILAEAQRQRAELRLVTEGTTFTRATGDPQDARFSYRGATELPGLVPSMIGSFQATNAALAVAAVEAALPRLGKRLDLEAVQHGLATARIPARLEVLRRRPRVILDGAHNPQKLAAALEVLCADRFRGKLVAVFGQLASKDAEEMVRILGRYCKLCVATEPSVYGKQALRASELVELLERNGITAYGARAPRAALDLAQAMADGDDRILVTGSLYLAGEMREIWYRQEQIVEQGTSWPK